MYVHTTLICCVCTRFRLADVAHDVTVPRCVVGYVCPKNSGRLSQKYTARVCLCVCMCVCQQMREARTAEHSSPHACCPSTPLSMLTRCMLVWACCFNQAFVPQPCVHRNHIHRRTNTHTRRHRRENKPQKASPQRKCAHERSSHDTVYSVTTIARRLSACAEHAAREEEAASGGLTCSANLDLEFLHLFSTAAVTCLRIIRFLKLGSRRQSEHSGTGNVFRRPLRAKFALVNFSASRRRRTQDAQRIITAHTFVVGCWSVLYE